MPWYIALFSFKGRLNRQGFWLGLALDFGLFALCASLFDLQKTFEKNGALFAFLCLLLAGWIFLALAVKRLHDRGRSGVASSILMVPALCYWVGIRLEPSFMAWALANFMPLFIATLLLLDWGVFKGQAQANAYGERGLSIKFFAGN